MSTFQEIMRVLDAQMTRPESFGWFHLMFIAIIAVATVLLCVFCRKGSDRQTRIILLVSSIIMILFEIYKQLNFSYNATTGVWDFQWYAFPFQFCSVPMYIALIAGCCRKGKFQDSLCSFLAFFGFVAGITTIVYPEGMLVSTIGINIQTMVHHGLILLMSIWLMVSGRVKLTHRTFLRGTIVFIIMVAIATGLNYGLPLSGVTGGESFNMFYISQYFPCPLPLLGQLYALIPYPAFVVLYIVGFILSGYIIFWLARFIQMIVVAIKNNRLKKKAILQASVIIEEASTMPTMKEAVDDANVAEAKRLEKEKEEEIKEQERLAKVEEKAEQERLEKEEKEKKEIAEKEAKEKKIADKKAEEIAKKKAEAKKKANAEKEKAKKEADKKKAKAAEQKVKEKKDADKVKAKAKQVADKKQVEIKKTAAKKSTK